MRVQRKGLEGGAALRTRGLGGWAHSRAGAGARGRGCGAGVAGWVALGGGLEALAGVRSVNGWEGWAGLREGGLATADLAGTELAVAAARFLPRSAATLTALDARCRRACGQEGG